MKLMSALAILAASCSVSSLAVAQTSPATGAQPEDGKPAIAVSGDATASSAADDVRPDDIIVTGVRASLLRSAEIKRQNDTISDTISAEDIGKFPDANVADSLQRITGVQISRTSGGEGRFVSIRGLGSQFNLTTFNSRVLATDNAGRDFSFDVLPSEALASATVYKTPNAALTDGSIGGLIELTTLDPLSRPGFHISGNAGGLYDQASKQITPRFGVVASDTFADNRLGVFAGLYYYKRNWRSDTFESFGGSTEAIDANGNGCFTNCTPVGRAAFPGIVSYQVKNGPRERISLVGGVQWEPSDRLKMKLDAFYSHYDTPENNYSYNINFYSNDGWSRFTNATLAPWAGPGPNQYLLTAFSLTNIPVELGTDTHVRKVKTWEVGWNTVWEMTDAFTAKFDVAYSRADRPNHGQDLFTVAGVTGANYQYTLTDAAPTVQCTLAGGRSCYDITNDEIGLHFMQQKGEATKDRAFSSRLDFEYGAGALAGLDLTLKYGGFYSNRKKDKDYYESPDGCGYCGFTDTLGSVGIVAIVPFPSGGYRAGTIGNDNRWPALDAQKLFEAAILSRGQAYFDSTIAAVQQLRNSSYVDEDQYGGYLQASVKSDRIDGNVGLRYVRTRDAVRGYSQQLLSLTPIPNSTNFTAVYSPVQPVSATNSYGNWLPSANVTYKFQPNLLLRAGLSKAVTRPTFSQLGLDMNFEVNSPPPRISQNGNPMLKAIRADSADLSLEWYGRQGSSASVALFYKKIKGFITTGTFDTTIVGLPGRITLPINGDTATLKGAEVAFQHIFPNGFGGQANYTFVDDSARLTLTDGTKVKRELDGVSRHTFNLSGFYEKGPLSLRLSYAYRSKFTDCAICGPANTPSTTEASGFLDFSGSVKITSAVSLYLDVYNITEESTHRYVLDKRDTLFFEPFARRFEFGARASF